MVAPESEGHLQRDKDGCPPFPGEAYTITQYNTWLRDFRGYCARKGCLSVLISGESDDSFESLEERQKANRKANSTLYGLLMRSMAQTATELANEIEERFLVTEGRGYADGFEAVKYLKDRVRIDSFHRNDVVEKRISKLLLAKLPENCSRDQFRTKAGELRELNRELISGKREGAALSAAYFQLLPTSIREAKHALETRLKATPLSSDDPEGQKLIEDPVAVLAELEDLVERVNLDNEAATQHAAYMASMRAMSANVRETNPDRKGKSAGEKRHCKICNSKHAGPCFGDPIATPELPSFMKQPKNAKWLARISDNHPERGAVE